MRALVIALVLAGIGGAYMRYGRGAIAHDDVPTVTVAKTKFVRRVSADGTLRAVEATEIHAPQGSEDQGQLKVSWIAADGAAVKKDEVVIKFDPLERQKALREGQADLDSATSKLHEETLASTTAERDRDSDSEIATEELEVRRRFQAKDEQIYSRKDIIEAQLDEHLATSKLEVAQQAKSIEKRLSHSKAELIEVDQKKANMTISHAQKDLEGMEVKAPHDGIFVIERRGPQGEMVKVGDQVWPGMRLAELPLIETMEAELFVLEVDGTGLANGQPAEIVVEARPDVTFKGTIRLVDKLAKPRVPGVPVQYFAVVIKLDQTDATVMKPGQRVRGTMILDQEDALVVPREAIANKDGKNFVWKRDAHGWQTAEVELGAGTSGRVVVKSGLAEGDVVALRDPTRSLDAAAGSGSGSAGGGGGGPPGGKK